jgi:hypothetical protein
MHRAVAACALALGLVFAVFTSPAHADPSKRMAPSPDAEAALTQRTILVRNVAAWDAAIGHNWIVAARWLSAHASARTRAPHRAHSVHSSPASSSTASSGSGTCGGNLPPCYVMMRESGGSLTAENPVSTASGKWQFLDSTWDGYGGYAHASDAPESVQDARAAQVWNGGAGCSNWSAC